MIFPAGYRPVLDIFETQRAIKIVKDTFERVLAAALNLERVTAPVIVRADSAFFSKFQVVTTEYPTRRNKNILPSDHYAIYADLTILP